MAYYHYMTDPMAQGIISGQQTKHVPFRVYAKITPSHVTGKRMVYMRDGQKIASFIETDLKASGFNIAEPVAFTNQIGQNPARVTIIGFWPIDRTVSPNTSPTTAVHLIHSGTDPGEKTAVMSASVGGSTSWGQDVLDRVDDEALVLKKALETSSDLLDVYFMDYNGVKYGNGHRSWPIG